jgi:hypothetical protein
MTMARPPKLSALLLLSAFLIACGGGDPSGTDQPRRDPNLVYEGWWMDWDAGYQMGHDGQPYESDNFVVYSDGCPAEERQRVAAVLEAQFIELKDSLQVSSHDEFIYATPDRKLHIFLSRYQVFPYGGGVATQYGFMLYSRDSPRVGWAPEVYDLILIHEMMHVIQGLLCGAIFGDAWFVEGIAEYVSDLSGLRSHQKVSDASMLQQWMSDHADVAGRGNPVAVHTWLDYRSTDPSATGDYGPYYELAVRYLLDPRGLGGTWADVKDLFLDMRQGTSFNQAFATRLALSLAEYEQSFFDLMLEYLP